MFSLGHSLFLLLMFLFLNFKSFSFRMTLENFDPCTKYVLLCISWTIAFCSIFLGLTDILRWLNTEFEFILQTFIQFLLIQHSFHCNVNTNSLTTLNVELGFGNLESILLCHIQLAINFSFPDICDQQLSFPILQTFLSDLDFLIWNIERYVHFNMFGIILNYILEVGV